MRTCGLEEHRAAAGVAESGRRQDPQLTEPITRWAVAGDVTSALLDLDDGRLAAMDEAGIDTAVLSLTTPGLQNLAGTEAVALQGPTNDAIAAAVRRHLERFQGFGFPGLSAIDWDCAQAGPVTAAAAGLARWGLIGAIGEPGTAG